MQRILILFLALALTACGKFSKDEIAQQEQAFSTMMEAHDRAMPRMGEIADISRGLRDAMADSLATDSTKEAIMNALQQMEKAEDGMMTWMSEIQLLDKLQAEKDHAAILAYFKAEDERIRVVENDIATSISAGQALLGTIKSAK